MLLFLKDVVFHCENSKSKCIKTVRQLGFSKCGLLDHTMISTNIDTKRTKKNLCIYLPCELFTFCHCFQSLLKACRAQAQAPTRILVYHFHLSTHFHKQLTTPRNETRSSIFSSQKLGMVSRISSPPQAGMTNFVSLKAFKKNY